MKDRAIHKISKNLVYASPKLIASYHQIKHSALSDESGMNPTGAELKFLHDFTREYVDVIQKTSFLSSKYDKEQISPIILKLVLSFLQAEGPHLLSYYWYQFDMASLTLRNYNKLQHLVRRNRRLDEKLTGRAQQTVIEMQHNLALLTPEQQEQVHLAVSKIYDKLRQRSDLEQDKVLVSAINLFVSSKYTRKNILEYIQEQRRNNA